jgi:putative membrane protein
MDNVPPRQLLNPTNELAKERNRAAAERTLNAWAGICLSFLGFGVAFDQIFRSLQRQFPQANSAMTQKTAALIGMGFVGVSLVLLGLALVQRRLTINAIEQDNYVLLSVNTLNRLAVATVAIAGLVGLGVMLFML